jgi:hypothetical protein
MAVWRSSAPSSAPPRFPSPAVPHMLVVTVEHLSDGEVKTMEAV